VTQQSTSNHHVKEIAKNGWGGGWTLGSGKLHGTGRGGKVVNLNVWGECGKDNAWGKKLGVQGHSKKDTMSGNKKKKGGGGPLNGVHQNI